MKNIIITAQVSALVLSKEDAKVAHKIIGNISTTELMTRFGLTEDECRIASAIWNFIEDELRKDK